MATGNIAYGTYAALTTTNLDSLANDATDPFGAWQSAIVDNRTTLALDEEISIKIPTAATAPANDSAAYVYAIPWIYNGAAWVPGGNFGTTTEPTGSEGTASISDPNSMAGPLILPYKVTSQTLEKIFSLVLLFGGLMPQGWSLAIRNCTGAAFSTGTVVSHVPITYTVA